MDLTLDTCRTIYGTTTRNLKKVKFLLVTVTSVLRTVTLSCHFKDQLKGPIQE